MVKLKLSESHKTFLMGFAAAIFGFALIFLSAILGGCTNNAKAGVPEDDPSFSWKYKAEKLEDVVRAYNHLLHRIWVDKPVYVEDVLTETDEFYVLDSLLNGNWADTFEFYDEEDSIAYEINLKAMSPYEPGCVRVVKHIVIDTIPEPTKSRLFQVFGNGDL